MSLLVQHAPDFSPDNPYQPLLCEALQVEGIEAPLLSNYRRLLPLTRGTRPEAKALHLHWPESYWRGEGIQRSLRLLRFPTDLRLATRKRPLFLTAHNLLPHGSTSTRVEKVIGQSYRAAARVFIHSVSAGKELEKSFGVPSEKQVLIPFGDHAAHLPDPPPQKKARLKLGLPETERIAFHFGAISRYKGSIDLLKHWPRESSSPLLLVAGPVFDEGLLEELEELASGHPRIDLRPGRIEDEELSTWFSAVDAAVFHYERIFSSGGVCLSLSFGLPVLLPKRCQTLDLDLVNDRTFPFGNASEEDFQEQLEAACTLGRSSKAAEQWKSATSWSEVARITASTYREHLA